MKFTKSITLSFGIVVLTGIFSVDALNAMKPEKKDMRLAVTDSRFVPQDLSHYKEVYRFSTPRAGYVLIEDLKSADRGIYDQKNHVFEGDLALSVKKLIPQRDIFERGRLTGSIEFQTPVPEEQRIEMQKKFSEFFVRQLLDLEEGYDSKIALEDPKRIGRTEIFQGPEVIKGSIKDAAPSWSPDGKRIFLGAQWWPIAISYFSKNKALAKGAIIRVKGITQEDMTKAFLKGFEAKFQGRTYAAAPDGFSHLESDPFGRAFTHYQTDTMILDYYKNGDIEWSDPIGRYTYVDSDRRTLRTNHYHLIMPILFSLVERNSPTRIKMDWPEMYPKVLDFALKEELSYYRTENGGFGLKGLNGEQALRIMNLPEGPLSAALTVETLHPHDFQTLRDIMWFGSQGEDILNTSLEGGELVYDTLKLRP
ncbi:MAG: PD40 domain-containing protein [Proteobacteria bacterium]|nr:PD40 domain-containing protein [Pseudomonadota bacterium]